MKKYLLLAALSLSTASLAQNNTLPLMDGDFVINGVERPFKTFKNYIGQVVKLEIEIRTHYATQKIVENSLPHQILEKLHFAKINAMEGHREARLKQQKLMNFMLSLGVSANTLTAMNEFYNEGDLDLLFKELGKKCEEKIAEACFEAGKIAQQHYKSGLAISYFENAYNNNANSSQYLATLAENYLQKDHELTEILFKKGLTLDDKSQIARLYFGLANYYGFKKNIPERINYLTKIAEMASTLTAIEDRRIITKTYIQLAKNAYESNQLALAVPFADKAVAMGLEIFPDAEIEGIAIGYNNIAAIYEDAGRKQDAEILYKKAIKIGEAFYLERKHTKLAMRIYNLGVLYVLDKRFEEGLAYQYKALKIATDERAEGNFTGLGTWLTGAAITNNHLNNPVEAENLFKKAQKYFDLKGIKSGAGYIQFIEHYSQFLRAQNRLTEAMALQKTIGQKT